ncbi:unnamed protein product, partial [Bubo scandiacus]
ECGSSCFFSWHCFHACVYPEDFLFLRPMTERLSPAIGVPSPPSSHPPPIKTTQVSLVKRPHNVEEAEKQQQQQERKRRLENITRLLLLLLRNLIETVTRSA